MSDRERAINHFVDAIDASGDGNKWRFVRVDILEDAIALLKAQAPVKPTRDVFGRCYCGGCDEMLLSHSKFCHNCGREVKRDAAD